MKGAGDALPNFAIVDAELEQRVPGDEPHALKVAVAGELVEAAQVDRRAAAVLQLAGGLQGGYGDGVVVRGHEAVHLQVALDLLLHAVDVGLLARREVAQRAQQRGDEVGVRVLAQEKEYRSAWVALACVCVCGWAGITEAR